MNIRPLKLSGCFEIELTQRRDERGYFGRTFDAEIFAAHGLPASFAQENESFTHAKGTLRGLHFQKPPFAETKLCTLEPDTLFAYKVDARYAPEAETGLPWNDPAFGIPWPTPAPFTSARDQSHAPFAQFQTPFVAGIAW